MSFVPVKKYSKEKIYQLRISDDLFDELNKTSKQQGVAKQELIRQMIVYCLGEIQPVNSGAVDFKNRKK